MRELVKRFKSVGVMVASHDRLDFADYKGARVHVTFVAPGYGRDVLEALAKAAETQGFTGIIHGDEGGYQFDARDIPERVGDELEQMFRDMLDVMSRKNTGDLQFSYDDFAGTIVVLGSANDMDLSIGARLGGIPLKLL